jgi:hypothetical protein
VYPAQIGKEIKVHVLVVLQKADYFVDHRRGNDNGEDVPGSILFKDVVGEAVLEMVGYVCVFHFFYDETHCGASLL